MYTFILYVVISCYWKINLIWFDLIYLISMQLRQARGYRSPKYCFIYFQSTHLYYNFQKIISFFVPYRAMYNFMKICFHGIFHWKFHRQFHRQFHGTSVKYQTFDRYSHIVNYQNTLKWRESKYKRLKNERLIILLIFYVFEHFMPLLSNSRKFQVKISNTKPWKSWTFHETLLISSLKISLHISTPVAHIGSLSLDLIEWTLPSYILDSHLLL